MEQLIITEKSSVALALAEYFGRHGNPCSREKGHYLTSDKKTCITWASGHLLAEYEPGDYKPEWEGAWWKTPLPMIPETFKRKVMKDKKPLYDHIQDLLKDAKVIINAADPDREGQTLGDEIIEGKTEGKIVKRLLLNALDDDSIAKALANIKDDKTYEGLYRAGTTRSDIDWIIGMNLTRYFTNKAHDGGYPKNETTAVGRVKGPAVGLIVKRQKEIDEFKPETYFTISALLTINGTKVKAEYDRKEKLKDELEASNIVNHCTGKDFVVGNKTTEHHEEAVTKLYSLDTLQIDADKLEGISAKETLDALQSLYENKYTTYPRSDCKYLPESQKKDAIEIAKAINGKMATEIGLIPTQTDNPSLMGSAVWNDKKITAHHAIIPTKNVPDLSKLNDTEKKIYLLIVRKYAGIFMKPYQYEITKVTGRIEGYPFKFQAKAITEPGYTLFYPKKKEEEEEIKGDIQINKHYPVEKIEKTKKKTQPPKPYTEGTLIAKMANIESDNEEYNKILGQIKGIGTPATRAEIISKIIKVDKHVEKKGKYLYPTEKGKRLIEILPKKLTEADYTAQMEEDLTKVEKGEMTPEEIIKKVTEDVTAIVKSDVKIINKQYPCPKCHNGYLLRRTYKSKYFEDEVQDEYRCSNPECRMAFPVIKDKPKIVKCPECGEGYMVQRHGKYGIFYGCSRYPDCKKAVKEKDFEKMKEII